MDEEGWKLKRICGVGLYAVAAGFCIGLGGTVFLRLKDAFAGGQVVGALLFAIGLFTICTRGYYLYTGKVSAVFDQPLSYTFDVCLMFVGNFFGCWLLAFLQSFTGLFGPGGIHVAAAELVAGKMDASYLSLFILGIFCNIFMFIAVNGYQNNPHQLGKYLAILLGVSVFILSGTEHSIANMYYWAVSGVLYEAPSESLLRIFVVGLGNAVGGVLLPLAERAKAYLDM